MKIDKDFVLLSEIRQIHKQTRGAYGARRIAEKLQAKGYPVGRYRAGSLMKKAGLSATQSKKFKVTTNSKHKLPVAPNLLNRNFDVTDQIPFGAATLLICGPWKAGYTWR